MKPSQIPASVKEMIEPFESDGCWIWQGDTRASGSPVINVGNKSISAKMAFYHFLKEPLPDPPANKMYRFYPGACDNKLCVKPELYKHMVLIEASAPAPRLRRKRQNKKVPWDKDRVLRFHYGHENPEEQFEEELITFHDRICELINASVNYFEEDQCISWQDLIKHYDQDSQYSSADDFAEANSNNYRFEISCTYKQELYSLPVKRALYVYWNDLDPYFLLSGMHRLRSKCKDKTCHAPWHMVASVRTPGTRNAKTDWVS